MFVPTYYITLVVDNRNIYRAEKIFVGDYELANKFYNKYSSLGELSVSVTIEGKPTSLSYRTEDGSKLLKKLDVVLKNNKYVIKK